MTSAFAETFRRSSERSSGAALGSAMAQLCAWQVSAVGEPSRSQLLARWFNYRRKDCSRPIIGDMRPPSPLVEIQAEGWLPQYTTELLNVAHVLARLLALDSAHADLLGSIAEGPLLGIDGLGPVLRH